MRPTGEDLGTDENFMHALPNDRIRDAVLSFGGFLGFGHKLFADPAEPLHKDDWRDTLDETWQVECTSSTADTTYWR